MRSEPQWTTAMARMIFCHVAWMTSYGGYTQEDRPVGGGTYSAAEKAEVFNFKPLGDHMFGYVPAHARTINVSRIGPAIGEVACAGNGELGCCDTRTESVDVIWTAQSPKGGRVVVGWYRDATVFQHLQSYERGSFQIKARAVDCRLLPVENRTLTIERARERDGGPGISAVWYAESEYGTTIRRRVLRQIKRSAHQIFDRHELDTKAATLKVGDRPPKGAKRPWRDQRQIAVVARDPEVHAWILKTAKGRCELCGSAAPFANPAGRPYLEIHHVDRLADGGADVPDNAVALCPNCHREAHYGARKEEICRGLRQRIASRQN